MEHTSEGRTETPIDNSQSNKLNSEAVVGKCRYSERVRGMKMNKSTDTHHQSQSEASTGLCKKENQK